VHGAGGELRRSFARWPLLSGDAAAFVSGDAVLDQPSSGGEPAASPIERTELVRDT